MKIAVACDHAGFPLKEIVLATVLAEGHQPIDLGTNNSNPVDFPDYTEKLGQVIQKGEANRGILVCGSGIGACIAANKMKGIYASICHDTYSAAQGVMHDNMKVLCRFAIEIEVVPRQMRGEQMAHDVAVTTLFRRVKTTRIDRPSAIKLTKCRAAPRSVSRWACPRADAHKTGRPISGTRFANASRFNALATTQG